MPELYEVVDEHDVSTGRMASKEVIHTERLHHRAAAIYVFDVSGELYVQVHKKSGGLLDHAAGGHVDPGETYREAAVRELKEELDMEADLQEVATGYASPIDAGNHHFGIYTCIAPRDWVFSPNDEVEELRRMSVEQIVQDINAHWDKKYTPGFICTMQKYLETAGGDLEIDAITS